MVRVFARLLQNSRGSLVRDDFNFTVGFYNDCRCITRRIESVKAPGPYKQALREFYSRRMIEQGEAKDIDAQIRRLASLPDGALVVASGARPPDLAAMVASVLPEFQKLDVDRKAALLDVVCTLNPWVNRRAVRSGGEKVDGVREKTTETIRYEVAEGLPILVPPMSYLEAHAPKEPSRK